MEQSEIDAVLAHPVSQEMLNRDLARLAFVALDGTPRVLPTGFAWNGTEVVMCTATNARRLPALRENPAVALTIDTEVHPPNVLLLRGDAVLDEVEGIPDEYLQANAGGSYEMTEEQRVEWEAGVRSLYDGMVRIVVKPTWAKVIDFEETLPTAIEELVQRREARQG
jgi:Pyridoxamine 5'-phosphate oxidase